MPRDLTLGPFNKGNAMRTIVLGLLLLAPLIAAPAWAIPMEDLARQRQCFDCHDQTKQLTASSFQSIAKKYHGVKNADVMLADEILSGGPDHFGTSAMPSGGGKGKLTREEAKGLAHWVLNTK